MSSNSNSAQRSQRLKLSQLSDETEATFDESEFPSIPKDLDPSQQSAENNEESSEDHLGINDQGQEQEVDDGPMTEGRLAMRRRLRVRRWREIMNEKKITYFMHTTGDRKIWGKEAEKVTDPEKTPMAYPLFNYTVNQGDYGKFISLLTDGGDGNKRRMMLRAATMMTIIAEHCMADIEPATCEEIALVISTAWGNAVKNHQKWLEKWKQAQILKKYDKSLLRRYESFARTMRCGDKGIPSILDFMPKYGVMFGRITECIKMSIVYVLELMAKENEQIEPDREEFLAWDSTLEQFEDRIPSEQAAEFTRNCFEEIFPSDDGPESPRGSLPKQSHQKEEQSDGDSDLASDDGRDPFPSLNAKTANFDSDTPDFEAQGLADEDIEDSNALNIDQNRNGGDQTETNPFDIEIEEDELMGRKRKLKLAATRPAKKQKTGPKKKKVNPFHKLIAERRRQKKIDQFRAFEQQIDNVEAYGAGVWTEKQIKQMRLTLSWVQQRR